MKTICEAVSEKLGEEVTADTEVPVLQRHARAVGLDLPADASWGFVLEEIYGELCEATTTTPVFYNDFPKENVPLTRQHRRDPRLAEKWDLVVFGAEQGTAYSELIDPVDQRERPGARHAADRWHGDGYRPAGDEPDRAEHPRHHPVPAGPAEPLSATSSRTASCSGFPPAISQPVSSCCSTCRASWRP